MFPPEYIKFIREYLEFRFYNEFIQFVKLTTDEDSNTKIVSENQDKWWLQLFDKYHSQLKYYHMLCQQNINPHHYAYTIEDFRKTYSTSDYSDIFPCTNFQDYVDNMIQVKTINMVDYHYFISLMNDPAFREQLKTKYQHYQEDLFIKNQFTHKVLDHCVDGNLCLNIIPYCQYLSSRPAVDNNIVGFKDLEDRVISEINEYLDMNPIF